MSEWGKEEWGGASICTYSTHTHTLIYVHTYIKTHTYTLIHDQPRGLVVRVPDY